MLTLVLMTIATATAGEVTEVTKKSTTEYAASACERNSSTEKYPASEMCFIAGVSYMDGLRGVAKDTAKGVALLETACTQHRRGDACFMLSRAYRYSDPKRALGLVERACDLREAMSCGIAAHAYRDGEFGARKNAKRVLQYGQIGCDGGDPYSCETVGVMYVAGELVPKDDGKALEWLLRSCDGYMVEDPSKAARHCSNVAALAAESDPVLAAALRRKATQAETLAK